MLTSDNRGPLPNVVINGITRSRAELIAYFRNGMAVVFSFLLPIALMLIFGTLFSGNVPGTTVPISQIIVAGTIGTSILTSGMTATSFAVASDRQFGTLKRLATTPYTPLSYLICRALYVVLLAIVQIAIIVIIGTVFFGVSLPSDAERWGVLVAVVLLGLLCSTFLGLTIGALVRSVDTAAAIVSFPVMLLQFVSGVFYSFTALPIGLQIVGQLFPLKWIAQGLRFSLLPDSLQVAEVGGQWNLPLVFAVIGAWTVAVAIAAVALLRLRRFE
ncbi:ABC transporter permease [Rathayibacter toxicus]|uniref:Transport permease protein n=1 Tax=Rathayibacter toxicus TaxID=145458 RepID=A0A0U1PU25_9MICO|nr:ABC transporter permease [Rathayibacter toxicus]KKM46146.1 hypothetical protein VT73_03540 [Rathayibacter toxicus]PPG23100.1 ABC transporter permease [Rathayibacter toxicus]PPG47683.1 ABC transporter permease [Rathayibacter toxicus]PPH64556.1 ABC transporter permease [Rathayibacter toxicus]PPH68748.1 ABC transporter permease [Rathayibacter toxicus]